MSLGSEPIADIREQTMLKVHQKIQDQGSEARKLNVPLEENPYRLGGGKGKEAKQAAWATGWRIEDTWQKRGAPDFICRRK